MPSGGTNYFDMPLLGGGKPAGVGSIGGLVSPSTPGSSASKSSSGFGDFLSEGGSNLIGEGASLVAGLFGNNPAKDKAAGITDKLSTLSDALSSQGEKTHATGMDALQPVLKYLNGLLSGNPADVQAATAPERASILNQYDTARTTLERTAPRGGGQVSAMGALEGQKASQLATTTATARSGAADKLSQLGTTLTGQGLSAEAYAGSDLATAVQASQRASEQQAKSNSDAGASIGGFIADALPFLLAL